MAPVVSPERALGTLDDFVQSGADEKFLSGGGLDTELSPSSVASTMYAFVKERMTKKMTQAEMTSLLNDAVEAATKACRVDIASIAKDVIRHMFDGDGDDDDDRIF